MKLKRIKFRASGVGALMVGQKGLTETQTARLKYLQERKVWAEQKVIDPTTKKIARSLTGNMETEVKELIEKRDAPFELSQTAKSFITAKWMKDKFGYKKIIVTPQMLKGHLCEQDAMELLSLVFPDDGFRAKNTKRMETEFYTGHADIVLKSKVEDTKCSFDLATFMAVKEPPTIYKAQGQVYMHGYEKEHFTLAYCLVDTPDVLIEQEQKRYFWKYGGDETNIHFQEAMEQVKINHTYSHIDPELRIKRFDMEYDPEYMKELDFRAELGNEFYHQLTLKSALETFEL